MLTALRGINLLPLGSRYEPLSHRLFARELAGAAHGLGLFSYCALRRLLIELPPLHLSEDALALHLLLQDAKRLLHIVVTNEDLQVVHSLCELTEMDGTTADCPLRLVNRPLTVTDAGYVAATGRFIRM
jgi:hypothetical protein